MQRITVGNGKTKYRGWTYAKKEVFCEPGWISDSFELREPQFYKLVTTVTRGDEGRKFYSVPVGQWNQLTTFEESKCENEPFKSLPHVQETTKLLKKEPRKKSAKKPKSSLIVPGASISKKEPSEKSAKKPKRLYIVPGEPTLLYQQGNHNSCILSSLASVLHNMGDGYAS